MLLCYIHNRDRYQTFENPKFPFYMREWTTSWAHIDEDDLDESPTTISNK